MKLNLRNTVLVLITTLSCISLFATKIFVDREMINYQTDRSQAIQVSRQIHPAEQLLSSRKSFDHYKRSTHQDNFNRLLVLLIDFQEDDNPLTTGNGKFVLEPDPDYPVSVGAPPRNYDYFQAHLEAMRYYYLAASLGNYDLEFDIYPKPGGESFAYTLPNEMAYYNPGMHNQSLFVERVEEYFQDAFKIADETDDIDFSYYGHYMFIHAGSDWQHDIYGDTPHDIPSFFVRVGEGKEAIVNNGNHIINSAANVPETISQDGRYGVINAVMAHEFGHSLGFVDLYNVNNFYPGVGYWDLMDSGGTGQLVMQGNDGELYGIEGGLPTLPSAWHRILVWEDEFREQGILKDIHEFDFGGFVDVTAASKKPQGVIENPYFIKVPLTETEYILIENRDLDPDRDGGTAFKGALPLTPGQTDFQVLLHPVGLGPDDYLPTYEYDLLLPGWIDRQGRTYGGGLVFWHIDEHVLFNEGIIDSQGNFISNYDNNTVNTNSRRRGIRIIEADNVRDIGNPYSMYWNGTPYEPFYRYLPELDNQGYFLHWSYDVHNYEISSNTEPMLKSNNGQPSIYRIYDISAIAPVMTFRYDFSFYDNTIKLSSYEEVKALGLPGISDFISSTVNLPIVHEDGVDFFTHFYSEGMYPADEWDQGWGTQSLSLFPSQPVISADLTGDSYSEHFFIEDESLFIVKYSFNYFDSIIRELKFQSKITDAPLVLSKDEDIFLVVPTVDTLFVYKNPTIINDFEYEEKGKFDFREAKLAWDFESLVISTDGKLVILKLSDLFNGSLSNSVDFDISDFDKNYIPVIYIDEKKQNENSVFIQNNIGKIFKINNGTVNEIFNLSSYTQKSPSQLAITKQENGMIYIVFTAGEYVFAIDIYGNLAINFPLHLEGKDFKPYSFPRVISFAGKKNTYIFEDTHGSYWSVTEKGILTDHYSYKWNRNNVESQIFWEESSKRLNFLKVSNNSVFLSYKSGYYDNPILWNGYRNGFYSVYQDYIDYHSLPEERLTAYVFPNPVISSEMRVRIFGVENSFELSLFDITGRRLFSEKYIKDNPGYSDIRINTMNLSSGVYFGIVKSEGKVNRFSFAVEK